MPRVVMYATRFCPYCYAARRLLEGLEIAYEEIDVGAHPKRRAEMLERAGGRSTVPQIFIDGESVGGYDELRALVDEGGLRHLL
jgi:glutaredoxin 3